VVGIVEMLGFRGSFDVGMIFLGAVCGLIVRFGMRRSEVH